MRTRSSSFLFCALALFAAGSPRALSAGIPFVFGGGFDKPIPADTNWSEGWMEDVFIDVTGHLIISDIDVAVDIEHTNAFDLEILLRNPAGMEICLSVYDDTNDFFTGANYSDTIFDDQALVPIEQGEAPFNGRFRPKQGNLLGIFEGTDAFGLWRLRIEDHFHYNTGRLKRYELMITVPEPATFLLLAVSGFFLRRRN